MTVVERFLRYVTLDTQSAEDMSVVPSTEKQKELGRLLTAELTALGLYGVKMDERGYVYAWLPATPGCEHLPTLGLIAHMDTSPDVSGAGVRAQIVHYEGGDIVLNERTGARLCAAAFESLAAYVGKDLIVTDGTTLLGADDKAGIAEIMSAVEHLLRHPETRHGRVAIGFTPDEEIGCGADYFDVETFGAVAAYTVDGGELGELEYENFNAASAKLTVSGVNIHPGSAKNKMKNAVLIAVELAGMLPASQTPAHTEGYEGFYHLTHLTGDETGAILSYIIRDHDRASFEARKAMMERVVDFINAKYGADTVKLILKDSYYNMREALAPHMHLIERARVAFEKAGVTAKETPIRGGTDGARLSYMGLPCPNLSTGGANFHGIHEYIPVFALEKMVEVLVHLVTEE